MFLRTHQRLLSFVLFASVLGASRPGDFKVIGPGGGGAMFHPTVSPHDENTALVSCDMTGAYITHDGGRTWRMFNLRGTVRFFVFDPTNRNVIYAGATGLWRSTDAGTTWNLVHPKPSTVRAFDMNSDHADERIVAEPDDLGLIVALAIDPADSQHLYAAAGHGDRGALFRSTDYGETWQRQATLPELPLKMWIDPSSPRGSRQLLLAGKHSVTLIAGSTIQTFDGPDKTGLTDVTAGYEKGARPVVYATAEAGAYVSNDGGQTWSNCKLPGNSAHSQAVATSIHHPKTAYLSYDSLQLDDKKWMGIAKTVDAGKIWKLVWKEGTAAAPNVHDAWITRTLGTDWGGNPLALGVSEQNPELAYATDLGRTMQTRDGGRTWNAVYSSKAVHGAWTSTGLDVTTSYGIHFDPFDANRQFITYTDISLFRSEDGGGSWESSIRGVPPKWWNTTYWLEFDPTVEGRMWSVSSYTHDLPRPKMWRHTSPLEYLGGVCRSDDGGHTWIKSNSGMPETAATHILLDPKSSPEARTLYVAAFGRGVYKSSDGGAHWALKNNGIAGADPFAWRLALATDGALYVVVARRSEDGSIGTSNDGALYVSTDAAESWRPVALPEGVNGPNGLAIDPVSRRLYLAAWARAQGTHGVGGGVYISDDRGRNWRPVLEQDQHIYDVTVDLQDPAIVYASGFESSVWRSADRGEHWSRIPGFNFKWAHRVIVDPKDHNSVYVSTFGGSVWHGRVDGEPSTVDIATPQMMPGK